MCELMVRPLMPHAPFLLIWKIEIEETILQNQRADGLYLSPAHSNKAVFQEKARAYVFYLDGDHFKY